MPLLLFAINIDAPIDTTIQLVNQTENQRVVIIDAVLRSAYLRTEYGEMLETELGPERLHYDTFRLI